MDKFPRTKKIWEEYAEAQLLWESSRLFKELLVPGKNVEYVDRDASGV